MSARTEAAARLVSAEAEHGRLSDEADRAFDRMERARANVEAVDVLEQLVTVLLDVERGVRDVSEAIEIARERAGWLAVT